MIFEVTERDSELIVFVELPISTRVGKIILRQKITTDDMLEILREKGYSMNGENWNWKLTKESLNKSVKNWREHTKRATWVFEKKTIKPLDKPAEEVILTKEKKPAPKKRKSRAKKTTSK